MKRLLVVLAICFMSLSSFMGISEAAWELSGTDPELGPFWYDSSSIITGKDPGTVCFKLKVNRPDGKGGHMIEHIMIDQSRMYAVIFWGEMTNADGKVVVSTEQRTPLLIAGLTPAWKNVIATVLHIYDNTPPEKRKTFLDYVAPMVVQQGEEAKSNETKSNDSSAVASSPEKEAFKALSDFGDAVNNKQFEKAYNLLTPELKSRLSYKDFAKNNAYWSLKIIEHKVISSNDHLVKFQIISESSGIFKEGTVIRRFRETTTMQRTSSGWKLAGAETTLIDQKIIK